MRNYAQILIHFLLILSEPPTALINIRISTESAFPLSRLELPDQTQPIQNFFLYIFPWDFSWFSPLYWSTDVWGFPCNTWNGM